RAREIDWPRVEAERIGQLARLDQHDEVALTSHVNLELPRIARGLGVRSLFAPTEGDVRDVLRVQEDLRGYAPGAAAREQRHIRYVRRKSRDSASFGHPAEQADRYDALVGTVRQHAKKSRLPSAGDQKRYHIPKTPPLQHARPGLRTTEMDPAYIE